jgi:FAD dependent oxidoreductase
MKSPSSRSSKPESPSNRLPCAGTLPRRTFLHSIGAAAAFSLVGQRPLYGGTTDTNVPHRADGSTPLALREPCDVLICGSTLFACQLAVDAAKAGLRTVLAIDRVNPFLEGVACLRSWVDDVERTTVAPVLRAVLGNPATTETKGDRIYFNAMRAVLDLEDQLCAAGVTLLYNASPCAALGRDQRLVGAVFGGKSGLFAIEARAVVDATLEATVARAVGIRFEPLPNARRYSYTAELGRPAAPRHGSYRASGGVQVSFDVHHYYATFELQVASGATGPLALAEDFRQVYAAVLECPWKSGETWFRGADGLLGSGVDRMTPGQPEVPGWDNLLIFGPHGIPGNPEGGLILRKPQSLFHAFPDALAHVRRALRPATEPRSAFEVWNRGVATAEPAEQALAHSYMDPGFDEPGTANTVVRFPAPPVALRTTALVVGGGTSGTAAAYAAAKLGLPTVCLERGHELGGTNTLGGVSKLWYGNKTRAFDDYYRAMGAKNDGINAPGFFRGLTRTGCSVLFQTAITGVACEGRRVRRVHVVTPFGLVAIAADQVVDATGDGAVAAWAGCGYTFGGEHDELTLWGSFAGFRPGHPEAMRPFLSPVDERSPLDMTRFILAMRRSGRSTLHEAKHFPPPFFVAPRESRHIRGGKTITFLDVLAGRRFRDGILRVESNPDIKGVATSDAAKAGFIPLHWEKVLQVTIPYAALIPTGSENVIVAGKAYSATHDALSTARMQRDLCVMGLVAGEALRLARDRGVTLRDVPVDRLQQRLIAQGVLRPEDLADDDMGFGRSPAAIAAEVAAASDMDACLAASAQLCLLPRDEVCALLEPHAGPDRHAVNRVLGFLGRRRGTDHLVALVQQALAEPELSTKLFGGDGNKLSMPDQGYAPWTALRLQCLANAGDTRAVPLLAALAAKINLQVEAMHSSWGYLFSLACGFERLATPVGREPLRRVLDAPLFRNRLVRRTSDLRACRDTMSERLAYLRLTLARALTRCGDVQGALALCEFLDEARVCYARAARSELVAATQKDYGFRAQAWREWLDQPGLVLPTNPLTLRFG